MKASGCHAAELRVGSAPRWTLALCCGKLCPCLHQPPPWRGQVLGQPEAAKSWGGNGGPGTLWGLRAMAGYVSPAWGHPSCLLESPWQGPPQRGLTWQRGPSCCMCTHMHTHICAHTLAHVHTHAHTPPPVIPAHPGPPGWALLTPHMWGSGPRLTRTPLSLWPPPQGGQPRASCCHPTAGSS